MSKKKTNPARIPKTQADVDWAFREGMKFGQDCATVIFLTALWDKAGCDAEWMDRVGRWVNELAREIVDGRVTIADLRNTLKEDYHITFEEGKK